MAAPAPALPSDRRTDREPPPEAADRLCRRRFRHQRGTAGRSGAGQEGQIRRRLVRAVRRAGLGARSARHHRLHLDDHHSSRARRRDRGLGLTASRDGSTDRMADSKIEIESRRERRRENALLRATLENMAQGVAMYDGDHKLVTWNTLFRAISGNAGRVSRHRPDILGLHPLHRRARRVRRQRRHRAAN